MVKEEPVPQARTEEREIKASVAKAAAMMRVLKASEEWAILTEQMDRLEVDLISQILQKSAQNGYIDFDRGFIAALRAVKNLPDTIISWHIS